MCYCCAKKKKKVNVLLTYTQDRPCKDGQFEYNLVSVQFFIHKNKNHIKNFWFGYSVLVLLVLSEIYILFDIRSYEL